MNFDKYTTDQLVEIIIKQIGVPIPVYNYDDYDKYISFVPENISIGDGVIGIEKADMFDTFREACISIVQWAIDTNQTLNL